jgi:hypothetical protein
MAKNKKKDFETVRIHEGCSPQRNELIPLEEIGVPKMDNDPNLSCFLYNGHETKEVRNGSIIIADKSKIDHIPGELYVFRFFPYPETPTTFYHILRKLGLPSTLGGFELRSTGGMEILHVPSRELLRKITVGRVLYMYIDCRLARDRLQDCLGVEGG